MDSLTIVACCRIALYVIAAVFTFRRRCYLLGLLSLVAAFAVSVGPQTLNLPVVQTVLATPFAFGFCVLSMRYVRLREDLRQAHAALRAVRDA